MSVRKAASLCICVVAVLVALLSIPAQAQELRGSIVGVVQDSSGGVLPGVTVTLSSPALVQDQVTTTGSQGAYRFPSLPPGMYALTFELTGFQTLRREEIRLTLNMTVTINAALQIAGVEESVTITGESPVVDVKGTSVGTSFDKSLLQDIPTSRDIWSSIASAPGFYMQGYDVGGSHAGTQTGYTTYGFGDQNKTLVEGINVTEGTGGNGGYFDFGSIEEFQLGAAGNMGEQQGPGAVLNIVVKSGGDEFHGSVYQDYENEDTISDNVPDRYKQPQVRDEDGFMSPKVTDPVTKQVTGLQRGNPITMQYDFNADLGGFIWKEHAWFYTAFRKNKQTKYVLGLPDTTFEMGLDNFTVKGTYQLNSRNKFIGFFNRRLKLMPLRDISVARPPETGQYQHAVMRLTKVEWTNVVSDKLFLDAQVNHHITDWEGFPAPTQSMDYTGMQPGRYDAATGQYSNAYYNYFERITPKRGIVGSASYYEDNWAGTHNMKFGFEYQRERKQFVRFQPYDVFYYDRAGKTEEVDIYNTPNEAMNDTTNVALYAQDAWTVHNRLTLNLGARFDHYGMGWPAQSYTPNMKDFFVPVSVSATSVGKLNSIGPRVGMALDIFGDGKTVVKAFYGRFYFNMSTNPQEGENPVSQSTVRYKFTDLNGNMLLDPGPDGSLGTSPELGAFLRTTGGGGFVRVDRDLEHAYGEEISTHIEHELLEGFSIRGTYVYKNQRRNWGEVDVNQVSTYTTPFTYYDVGEDNIRGTSDDQVIQLLDRQAGVPGDRVYTNFSKWGIPDDSADYHTVEVALNRRFKDKWMLLTAFQNCWSKDFRSTGWGTGTGSIAGQGPSYNYRPNQRRLGEQSTTFWSLKVVGRYVFPYDIGFSSSFRVQSGLNYTREVSFTLPVDGSQTTQAGPLKDNRAPTVTILDIRGEKQFSLGKYGILKGFVDVFNALNSGTVVNFRAASGSRYKELIALLDPRIVRFGFRYEF